MGFHFSTSTQQRSPLGVSFLLLTLATFAACQQQPVVPPTPSPASSAWTFPERKRCHRSFAEIPVDGAALHEPLLVETSGIVPSLKDPTLLWMHNDSGDASRIYAVDVLGRSRLRVSFENANFVDVEDIAAGPCPDQSGPCLFIADTGDNQHDRTNAAIFIIPEPTVPPWIEGESSVDVVEERLVSEYWRIPISFPNGEAVDVEALVALPNGEGVGLFEKVDGPQARVFQLQAPFLDDDNKAPTERRVLSHVATVVSPGLAALQYGRMITAADLHPTTDELVVRTYTGIFLFTLPQKDLADLDGQEALVVTYGPASEAQGEAVCYDATGTGLWSISEDVEHKEGQPLHHYPCQ
ncbi:MAG: hypothetical protein GY822_25155 [Deltaproteobacteria bacterium]|nr:hypothetical protein [Deltaproteobacteria bacterium]